MTVSSAKNKLVEPKPVVAPKPAPATAAAPTAASPATATPPTTSSFAQPVERMVNLTPTSESLVSDAPTVRAGSGALLEGKLKVSVDVKKDLSSLLSSALQGPKPSNDPDNRVVTSDMSAEERKQYDKLTEEGRTDYNTAHLEALEAGNLTDLQNMTRALAAGAMPEYLELPPEERERADQLFAEAEALPEDQQAEARAQVANLIKEGKVGAYLQVEQSSSEDANLQALLFSGQLNGMTDDADKTMLDYLSGVASGEGDTGQGVNRGELIDQIITDVKNHEYNQPSGNRDCLALAAVSEFARRNPATYARLMTDLAETGQATLRNAEGKEITLQFRGPPDDGELTMTQEMFVESFANYIDREFPRGGDGNFLQRAIGALQDMFDGMTAAEAAELLDFTHGANYSAMTVPENDEIDPNDPEQVAEQARLRNEAKETIQEQLDAGEKPLVNIDGHWVLVERAIELPGGFTFYVVDDGTGNKTFATAAQIGAVVYNEAHSDVPDGSYNAAWDDPGTGVRGGNDIDPADRK